MKKLFVIAALGFCLFGCSKALKSGISKDSVTINNKAIEEVKSGDRQAALADFNKAINLDPNFARAYSHRGRLKYDLGDKQGALVDLKKAAELYKQQGKMDKYNKVMSKIEEIKKSS